MNRFESLLTRLKENGLRLTSGRKSILEFLLNTKKPVGAVELHEMLIRKKLTIDKVTVYRELATLTKHNIAHAVTFQDGIQRYEIAPEEGHNHHLVCIECKNVENIDMNHDDLHVMEKTIGKKKNFKIQSHSLEFYGTCKSCS